MKGCIFITMKDSMHGFTLAGFQQVVADESSVLEVFTTIVNSEAPGLVFIDERLLAERYLASLQLLEKQWGGAIISLPAPGKGDEPAGMDFGKRFISRVLGYQMKLS
jgi:vacuolar-type H+-ATPase subunit F/Vma7